MKRKKREEMTEQERIAYNNKKADNFSRIAICFSVLNILMLILAYLDKIVSFLRYVLSYRH